MIVWALLTGVVAVLLGCFETSQKIIGITQLTPAEYAYVFLFGAAPAALVELAKIIATCVGNVRARSKRRAAASGMHQLTQPIV
eukprot:g3577.t1